MKRLACCVAALGLAGCVTQGKYDLLQKDLDDTRAELTGQIAARDRELQKRETQNVELKKALEAEEAKSRELAQRIQQLESDLEASAKAKGKLEVDLATMVKDKSQLQASVQDMQAALAELARRKAEADARIAEFRSLLGRFKGLIDSGKLKVKMAEGRMVVELASDVLFSSGSANLSRDGKAAIAEVAQLLSSIPDRKFQVEGHTDNVPIATAQYPSNWELASARALTVVKTMVDNGMVAARISAASFGDSKPAHANDTPEGRAANRRIEIVVVPDLSTLPGFEELQRVSTN
ncbi:MAG: OmpA family protein [Myxococcales bacterium]